MCQLWEDNDNFRCTSRDGKALTFSDTNLNWQSTFVKVRIDGRFFVSEMDFNF